MTAKKHLWAGVLSILVAGTAQAAPASPIDSRVRLLYDHHAQRGETLPLFRRSAAFEQTGVAPLVIRWSTLPTAEQLATYEALGLEVGRTLSSGATLARAPEQALDAMVADDVLARVSVDLPPPILLQPLDEGRIEVGIRAGMATHRLATGEELDGQGVVVGDFDSRADIYHPAFFRAQAPVAWVDVDLNEILTPGVDGVDVDWSGTIEPNEVLQLLNGNARDLFGTQEQLYGTADPGLNPSWDYLYLDANGDGRRNVGPEVAGADALPTMGEQVYAVDDVDRDGVIRLPEKVLPLGESKFRGVYDAGQAYLRGENLATFVPADPFADGSHGTRMMGGVASGQPGVSRFLGYAPGVELLLAVTPYSLSTGSYLDPVQWLADEGADIVLTEIGYFGTDVADGSSELELLLDSFVDQGIVVVSPAGNLGYSGKHAIATIPDVNAAVPYQNELVIEDQPGLLYMSVTWREGDVTLIGSLDFGDGDVIDLGTEEANGTTPNGRNFTVAIGTTPKGAGYVLTSMSSGPGFPASGTALSLQSNTTGAHAELFLQDNASSWAGGANFDDFDLDGCMNAPSRAQKAIALSAYALHVGSDYSSYPEAAGALRGFSGRGPNLWGEPGIAIAAPDNAVSPFPDAYSANAAEGLQVHWSEAGGTSGAGAAVAGMAALIKQRSGLAGEALRDEILASARSDAQVAAGTAAMWGAGKLSVGIEPAAGAPPVVTGVVATVGPEVTALVTDDGDSTQMRSRWDFGYDGVWDRTWDDGLSASYDFPDGSPVLVKVEVMDDAGWTASALASIEEPDPPPQQPVDDGAEEDGCGCHLPGRSRPFNPTLFWSLLGLALVRLSSRRRRDVT